MSEPVSGTPARRWRIDLGYDGSGFSGWAVQPGRRTVQGELAETIGRVLRLPEPPDLVCAGRTDAGVHARGQVAHLDLAPGLLDDGVELTRRLTRVLRPEIVVRSIDPAPAGFDARFAAIWRRYVYRLIDVNLPDPLLRASITAVRRPVDLDLFNAAATGLLGLHDFAAFCRRREGSTTIRTLLHCEAVRVEAGPFAGVIEVTVIADAFCHSMVRSLVGALVSVADGRRPTTWLRSVATAAERVSTVEVIAAGGLTLEEVGYPDPARMAERAREARAVRILIEPVEGRTR
ncbi:MAG: tRNA pseudouridine(38-40) synthase TruA [Propionibacteriaceae bacterium]